MVLSGSLHAAGPEVTWRELLATPAPRLDLLAEPEDFADIVPDHALPVEGNRLFTEVLASLVATHDALPQTHYFFCTVYYTPREGGFTAERGFNTTPVKRGGRSYGSDFSKATYVEGFGRIAEPVGGRTYLAYDGTYHTRILGNRGNTLLDRESIAVHRGNPLFRGGTKVSILDPGFHHQFGSTRFEVGDTGGGLYRSQIDLYWGEDDPLGPGIDIWRPASCDLAVSWIVPVWVWP